MNRLSILTIILLIAGCHNARVETTSITPTITKSMTLAEDGVPIAYDMRGQGSTTLVFIHGWACDRTFWREQVDVFAKQYRVVTLDLPAHGESGKKRNNWTIQGLGEDVATLVNHLGLQRVVLIGHSMGGLVALEAARRLEGRILGIVSVDTLVNVEFEFPPDKIEPFVKPYIDDFVGTTKKMIHNFFPESSDPQLVDWVLQKAYAMDRKAAVDLLRDYAKFDSRKMISVVNVPIRGINAALINNKGWKTEIEINRKYADYDAVLIEHVSHYLMLEKPVEFNKHLKKILTEFTTN